MFLIEASTKKDASGFFIEFFIDISFSYNEIFKINFATDPYSSRV